MTESNKNDSTENEHFIKITFDATAQRALKKLLKCGIYKELRKRDILSDAQLNSLLKHNL